MSEQLQIVSKQQAIKLKALGFNWSCLKFYYNLVSHDYIGRVTNNWNANTNGDISAPETSLALKWFRDVHQMHEVVSVFGGDIGEVEPDAPYEFNAITILDRVLGDSPLSEEGYNSYEAAEEAVLDFLIEYLENNPKT